MAVPQGQSDIGEVNHVAVQAEEVASLRQRLENMARENEELRGIADASRQEVIGTSF